MVQFGPENKRKTMTLLERSGAVLFSFGSFCFEYLRLKYVFGVFCVCIVLHEQIGVFQSATKECVYFWEKLR
jgi:hypothetical protein